MKTPGFIAGCAIWVIGICLLWIAYPLIAIVLAVALTLIAGASILSGTDAVLTIGLIVAYICCTVWANMAESPDVAFNRDLGLTLSMFGLMIAIFNFSSLKRHHAPSLTAIDQAATPPDSGPTEIVLLPVPTRTVPATADTV